MPKITLNHPPSGPLGNSRREAFAQLVANGSKLIDAHQRAGYSRNGNEACRMRWETEVDARIRQLIQERVDSQNRAFSRRQKSKGDLLQRAVKELESIAFQDIGEIAQWERVPAFDEKGSLTGERMALRIRDSAGLPGEARRAIKQVFTKGGDVRIEMHDKQAALTNIIKVLTGSDVQSSTTNVTVNQTNIGDLNAVEAARRVAFMLRAMSNKAPPLIEAQPVHVSAKADDEPSS